MSTLAFSQGGTTASMNGIIKDLDGKPLVGATVKVKHLPTGTTSGSISQKNGRYNLIGLKVGGPFQISVSMVGYSANTFDNVYLTINQNLALDVVLKEKDYKLGQVDVVAKKNDVISSDRTGAANTVSESTIKSFPSISRSIGDYARLSPLATGDASGSNVAGRNSKYNNIQVDGAVMNDVFGLPSNGTPGGQAGAQPFSLDAIQEFQVSVAPYDVKYGGFTGGLINAITRSGTNKFSGSAYGFFNNESLVGFAPDTGSKKIKLSKYSDYTIGARAGGALIENQLFYFVNAESRVRSTPNDRSFDPTASNYTGVSKAEIDRIDSIAQNVWGLNNRGSYDPSYSSQTNDFKLFARLDYNLNDKNRFTLRHNFVNANADNSIYRNGTTYEYTSMEYGFKSMQNQTVLQLNSILDGGMFNELRVAFTSINDKREPSTAAMPGIQIYNLGTDKRKSVWMGTERSSQQNALDQTNVEITDNFTMQVDDFLFTLGTSNQFYSFDNLFIQDYYGYYEFSSIDNFKSGTWSRYRNSYLTNSSLYEKSAAWGMSQHAFYAQADWSVMPGLKVYGGVRAEVSLFPDQPYKNNLFDSLFSSQNYKTEEVPNGMFLLSPRIGFNWDVFKDKKTQLRGGAGLFTGRTPGVWLSNQYSNTGVDFARTSLTKYDTLYKFSVNPDLQPKAAGAATTSIAFTDPNFKMPSIWKLNLGFDQELEDGIILTAEILYQKTQNDVLFKNINLKDSALNSQGRYMFYQTQATKQYVPGAILMTNTDQGSQIFATIQLQKLYGQGSLPGLSANISYTWSQVKDVNSATSSVAYSNWSFNYADNPNNAKLTLSNFDTPHRVMANLGYTFDYLDGFSTTIGMYFEYRSGQPFTFVYSSAADVNFDGVRGNDIAFIPSTEGQLEFTTKGANYADFVSFINQFDGIDDQKGKIMERNSLRAPATSQLDLRIAQEIPIIKGHKFEITADVFNLPNLINSEYGWYKYVPFNNYTLLVHEGYNATGQEIVTFNKPTTLEDGKPVIWTKDQFLSRWRMQLGVRYTF
jgi:hypothetical protein